MRLKRAFAMAFLALVACALFPMPLHAAKVQERLELTFGAGTRVDDLDWTIAGPTVLGNEVNILSELIWSDIESREVRLTGRLFLDSYLIKGEAGYGSIYAGTNRDSDFLENDRGAEYSRSDNASEDGSVWDVSAALGYAYKLKALGGGIDLTPLAGLSYHRQNLTITDGVQTITTPELGTPPLGPIEGLDSTYSAGWGGPWAGLDLAYTIGKLKLSGSFEYHLAYYLARANWNLRTTWAHPVSFEHWATGTGVVFSAAAEYNISRSWSVTGGFEASDFKATDGTDRTYFASGAVVDTPLNEVNWDSRSAFLGLNYRF